MAKIQTVSLPVIRRLPRYYRFVCTLMAEGIERISSKELSQRMGLTASQIRQDLNCFGGFGQQGYGYNLSVLKEEIGKILNLDNKINTVIVGAGNIGRAVCTRIDFTSRGFELSAVFDKDPNVIGKSIGGKTVLDADLISEHCAKNNVKAAIICVPDKNAEQIVSLLLGLGVRIFWNFTQYDIALSHPDEKIAVENVHLNDSLMTLRYLAKEVEE
ncbi:MAG: redox-sensing transcriptional repressor Rex [Oscillospiraceae bacterium]|nr:redox-sensing transcriptional repressor Rex [Oscillospiraceae bacterium]